MKRLVLQLGVALLTFLVGYSAFIGVEIYRLKAEIREYEERVKADKLDERIRLEFEIVADSERRAERRWSFCLRKLHEEKKTANTSNMTYCLDTLPDTHW